MIFQLLITDSHSRTAFKMDGLLLVNKPKGPTSFQVIKLLRRITGEKKIGHTGTLDPYARGLLLVVFGKATKFVQDLQYLEKEYIAKVLLGVSTETDDLEGDILQEVETERFQEGEIRKALMLFQGRINQVPPRFSAVKHEGERAYLKARRGEDFQLQEREIEISLIRMVYYNHPFVKLVVQCSKGTYIRSLARDFGIALGSCATLTSLIRKRIGRLSIRDSMNVSSTTSREMIVERILPVSEMRDHLSQVSVNGQGTKKVYSVR